MRAGSLLTILIIIVIIAGGAWYLWGRDAATPGTNNGSIIDGKKTFNSSKYGIAFTYPETYFISEKNVSAEHHQIMIVEDTEENRDVLAGRSEGREGPTAVTLDIYEKSPSQSLDAWIRAARESNFHLSPDGKLSTTSFKGRQAFTYQFSGLYEADAIVFQHNNRAVLVSGTWLTRSDPIREVFNTVVESITLTP